MKKKINFEIMAVVADPTFAAEVEQMLLDDFAKSVEMQPGDYEKRSFWFKLGVRLARLTATGAVERLFRTRNATLFPLSTRPRPCRCPCSPPVGGSFSVGFSIGIPND